VTLCRFFQRRLTAGDRGERSFAYSAQAALQSYLVITHPLRTKFHLNLRKGID
jgi:hypothetical protein